MTPIDFDATFQALTGNKPFPWQRALYERFVTGEFPSSCDLPTGLGKTSVIAIWLIALAETRAAGVPRRLVYVVNRRTVVDQSTAEAENLRKRLAEAADGPLVPLRDRLRGLCAIRPDPSGPAPEKSDPPLAISTLRGQYADNREWSRDPARPAVIVGTVDMIGSRLLFSGYGCGFKTRPLHAGFLGQDSLLVHDEAHLEEPFQRLLVAIVREQRRCREFGRFRVMALSATKRDDADDEADPNSGPPFELTPEERSPPAFLPEPTEPIHHVWRRLKAKKGIHLDHAARAKLAAKIGETALRHKDSGKAVLIFVRTLDDVKKVRDALTEKKRGVAADQVRELTGTLRGLERDRLTTEDEVFARFLPNPKARRKPGTVYLICTSAGEVGLDISADHMVCDLTTLDAMAQRLGRVNRRGDGAAEVDVICESDPDPRRKDDPPERARRTTFSVLERLPASDWIDDRREGSPSEIGRLIREMPKDERKAAFAPPPTVLPTSDILFDAWALTTVRDKLPGRPPVEPYLHGVSEWEPPQTQVAWRGEVGLLDGLTDRRGLADLLEDYPLKPHELLRDRSDRVVKHLERLAGSHGEEPVWVIGQDDGLRPTTLGELVRSSQKDKDGLRDCTVVLPPEVGGLTKAGTLGDDDPIDPADLDVADEWYEDRERTKRRRRRTWDDEDASEIKGMRLVRSIDTRPDAEEEAADDDGGPARRFRNWYVLPKSADDDGSRTAVKAIRLRHHSADAEDRADRIAKELLGDRPELREALVLAARFHDLGKARDVWQRGIGNPDPKNPEERYAKSGKGWKPVELTPYRHEFGSLIDVRSEPEFRQVEGKPDVRDLVLHLIAAHHGYARPHFPPERAIDQERTDAAAAEAAAAVSGRFAHLQRRYGRWGLAYLESLLRAADIEASVRPSQEVETP